MVERYLETLRTEFWVVSTVTKVVHLAGVSESSCDNTRWRTICGWPYMDSLHIVENTGSRQDPSANGVSSYAKHKTSLRLSQTSTMNDPRFPPRRGIAGLTSEPLIGNIELECLHRNDIVPDRYIIPALSHVHSFPVR